MRMHRPLPVGAKVKSFTISQEADWWFAAPNYAAAKNGGRVRLVPPQHTSQFCPDPFVDT